MKKATTQASTPSTIFETHQTPIAIYAEGGIGTRLSEAMHEYRRDYVFSPDDFADHEPNEFEALMLEDFLNGAFTETVSAILQEAAQAIEAKNHTMTIMIDASAAIGALSAQVKELSEQADCWQSMDTAPKETAIVVWWPIVSLDENGDPTDRIESGQAVVSEWNGGHWLEPDVLNAVGDHMGDDFTYAANPSHWMRLPGAPIPPAT